MSIFTNTGAQPHTFRFLHQDFSNQINHPYAILKPNRFVFLLQAVYFCHIDLNKVVWKFDLYQFTLLLICVLIDLRPYTMIT